MILVIVWSTFCVTEWKTSREKQNYNVSKVALVKYLWGEFGGVRVYVEFITIIRHVHIHIHKVYTFFSVACVL